VTENEKREAALVATALPDARNCRLLKAGNLNLEL
jgi:hypothetical protein